MHQGQGIDQETLDAIAELLMAGDQHGIGITFTPDDEGWQVGYMRGMGGGDLASAYPRSGTSPGTGGPFGAAG